MHQKDIQENDPFGQNRNDDEAEAEAEKSFLKALLAERALKNIFFPNIQLFVYILGMAVYVTLAQSMEVTILHFPAIWDLISGTTLTTVL